MDENQGTRRSGPMVLLLAVLAMLGIRTFSPDSAPLSGDRAKLGGDHAIQEGAEENGGAVGTAKGEMERFAELFRAFREVRPVPGLEDKSTKSLSDIGEIKNFMETEDVRCIVACVPDPMDSGSGDRFDTLIGALQRAAETQDYVLDRFYYPWQKVKESGKGLRLGPLDLTSSETPQITKAQTALSMELQSPAEERPWKRFPGMLLFHTPPDSHPRSRPHSELLLVFLVGETATAGLHKDAFMTSLELIKRSKEYQNGFKGGNNPENRRSPGQVDVLGPCFSGSQVSLEKVIKAWAENESKDSNSPFTSFQLISGNATAIHTATLKDICIGGNAEKVKVNFHATVVPETTVIDALREYLGQPSDVAMLCESNTDYGYKMKKKWSQRGPTLFPFPLHIASVRAAYEKTSGATKGNSFRLPNFGSRLQLRLKGANTIRETEPSLAPEMTPATIERTLADILGTIARERFRYVFILATDIKDELFLATLVREYCPESRLVFTDTDLLLDHPDFSANLRGSIVGSSYPLHFRNQNWSYPFQGRTARFTFPGPRELGSYNAMIALLNPKDPLHFLEYGLPFQSAKDGKYSPPVWISIIGEGGLYPLQAEQRLDSDFPDYVFTAERPAASSAVHEPKSRFKPLNRTLWIVPVLGFSVLLIWLGWTYGSVVQGQASSSKNKNLFAPRKHGRRWQRFYVFICLASVLLVYWYLAYVWLIPVVHWISQNGSAPVNMRLGNLIAPLILTIVLPALFLFFIRERRRRVWLLCIFLFAGLIAILNYCGLFPPPKAGGDLLFFERATNLANGVTPVVPIVMLGIAFLCWTCFQLKRLYLLDEHDVDNPFPDKEPPLRFKEINDNHKDVGERLETRWRDAKETDARFVTWLLDRLSALGLHSRTSGLRIVALTIDRFIGVWWIVGVVLLFICCRLYVHFVHTVEGIVVETSLRLATVFLAVLIVCGWVHLRQVWEGTRKLLHAISLLPLGEAFAHLPSAVARMFGPNLSSERPGRQGHLLYQREQHDLLAHEYPNVANDLPPDALPAELAKDLEGVMKPCPNEPEPASQRLIGTARVCLLMLDNIWKDPRLTESLLGKGSDEGKDKPSPLFGAAVEIQKRVHTDEAVTTIDETIKPHENGEAVQKWLARVQDFVALEVTYYLSQFFVQLRNMALSLSLAPCLLLLAVSSYPFQPQHLWVLLAVALIGLMTLSVIWIVIQIERDELVSRILKTTPNQISFRWGFISHLLLYAIPLLGILGAMSSDMSDLVHSWADPLLQILK